MSARTCRASTWQQNGALARECGLEMLVEDVEVESLIPAEIVNKEYQTMKDSEIAEDALKSIGSSLDASMSEKLLKAREENKVLRYRFSSTWRLGRPSVTWWLLTTSTRSSASGTTRTCAASAPSATRIRPSL